MICHTGSHWVHLGLQLMMYLEDLVLELMKKDFSLPWIWIPTNDYTDHADQKDIHKGEEAAEGALREQITNFDIYLVILY